MKNIITLLVCFFLIPTIHTSQIHGSSTPNASKKTAVEAPDCSICCSAFENDELIVKMECTHTFHINCINSWVNTTSTQPKKRCPLCRASITIYSPDEGFKKTLNHNDLDSLTSFLRSNHVTKKPNPSKIASFSAFKEQPKLEPTKVDAQPTEKPSNKSMSLYSPLIFEGLAGFFLGIIVNNEFQPESHSDKTIEAQKRFDRSMKRTLYVPYLLALNAILQKNQPDRSWDTKTVLTWSAGILTGCYFAELQKKSNDKRNA